MSKNAFWVTMIFVAAIVGAFLGPALAQSLSTGAMLTFSVVTLIAIVGLIVWSLSSNKSGRKADTAALADARTMRAPDGKARIYVTRRGFVAALRKYPRAQVIDIRGNVRTIEFTGGGAEAEEFLGALAQIGNIVELARSGSAAIELGVSALPRNGAR